MKRLHLTTAMVFFVLAACTSADPTYTVPSRMSEHAASECPSDFEGKYRILGDPTSTPSLFYKRADGTLVLGSVSKTEGELPVTGEPTGDPHEGQVSAICSNGMIQLEFNLKTTGHFLATLIKSGSDFRMFIKLDSGDSTSITYSRL
jgi:hypothetical protein